MSPEVSRILLIIGIVLVIVGGLAALGVRLPFGRLPGDIAIEGERGGFYVPIVTMIIVSVVLTVLFNLFLRR
jgi:membrane protein implicated in regulation of membrane protease activity